MNSSWVLSAMLHPRETWSLTKPNLLHLQQKSDRSLISSQRIAVTIQSQELLAKLELEDLDLILRERTGVGKGYIAVQSKPHDKQVVVSGGSGRPEMDGEWLPSVEANNSWPPWSAMFAANLLPRGEWHINQNHDDDDDDDLSNG